MAAAAPPDFAQLEEQHAELTRSLAAFDRAETLAIIAGLLTLPQFHANTIRIEVLQNLVHRNAAGPNKPTRNRVAQWLNRGLGEGWAARMEDPVEDVFISNVVSGVGNSRVFEGVWESNDFWLQEALNALRAFQAESWASDVLIQSFALLTLSEALAARCGLSRYCMGGGSVRMPLDLPNQAELYARAALMWFSRRDLDAMGCSLDRLASFIHDNTPAEGGEGKSTLCRRPLIRDGDGVSIAIPAAISPAIRLRLVEALIQAGALERYERVLFSQQINQLFNKGVRALGGKIVEQHRLPPLPEGTPAKVQELVEFDSGKFAHIVFFEDSVLEFLKTGPNGILDLAGAKGRELHLHCERCAHEVATQPGYTGGLTIAVHGGLGRAFTYAAKDVPERWHPTGFRLPDCLALGRVRGTNLLQIWKLQQQDRELHARGIRLINVNGELNLLGYWQNNGERLVPRNAPASGAMLHVATDFIANVRHDLRSTYDLHAVARRNPRHLGSGAPL